MVDVPTFSFPIAHPFKALVQVHLTRLSASTTEVLLFRIPQWLVPTELSWQCDVFYGATPIVARRGCPSSHQADELTTCLHTQHKYWGKLLTN